MREAGGAVGYVGSAMIADLFRSTIIAIPLLVLLTVFGLLVVTATPIYQIPNRLKGLRDKALGRSADRTSKQDGQSSPDGQTDRPPGQEPLNRSRPRRRVSSAMSDDDTDGTHRRLV